LRIPFPNTPIAAHAAPFTHRFGYSFYWFSGTLEDAGDAGDAEHAAGCRLAAIRAQACFGLIGGRAHDALWFAYMSWREHILSIFAKAGYDGLMCITKVFFFFLDGHVLLILRISCADGWVPPAPMRHRVQGVYMVTGNQKFFEKKGVLGE
jgi:hypothetical protein